MIDSRLVRPAAQPKRREVVERLAAPAARNLTGGYVAAKDLSDFEIDEMRRVQRFARTRTVAVDAERSRGAQQDLEEGRSVDHDHRPSRSSRTARAGSGEGETGAEGVPAEVMFDRMVASVPPGSQGLMLQPYWTPGIRMPGSGDARAGAIHSRTSTGTSGSYV